MSQPPSHIKRVRTIADYQFGRGAGEILFSDDVKFQFSTTKRIRQILLDNERIATVRAKDGMLTLSMKGAGKLHGFINYPEQRVVVNSDAAPFVAKERPLFRVMLWVLILKYGQVRKFLWWMKMTACLQQEKLSCPLLKCWRLRKVLL